MIKKLIILLLFFSQMAWAQEGILNKLLAPGPLTEGHKDLEHKDCLLCHSAANGVPNDKCLSCHKDINTSIKTGNSFHAKQKKDCFQCHSDHKGRNFDSTKFDEKSFDHNQTGFQRVGRHSRLECQECHKEKRTKKDLNKNGTRWFGMKQSTCLDCHKSDDIHYFVGERANQQCSKCHGQEAWDRDIKFNHTTDAGYSLIGRHSKLECKECHIKTGKTTVKYKWSNLKSQKCLSCHTNQHEGKMSAKFLNGNCETCHSQQTWKITNFQHQVTGYQLQGKHSTLTCEKCHKQSIGIQGSGRKNYKFTGLKGECQSCHTDHHAYYNHISSNLGPLNKCQRCHNENSWKQGINFDHNNDTVFDIDGKHVENKCFDCHIPKGGKKVRNPKQRVYDWPALETKTCETCHKSPHYGKFPPELLKKKCTECHVTDGWSVFRNGKDGLFNHDATRFPLTGKHKNARCEDCHKNPKSGYKVANAAKGFCVSCHKNVHTKQFSPQFSNKSCAECHTTDNFTSRKSFDHNKTDFRITGKHTRIENQCGKCHKTSNIVLPTKPPKRGNLYQIPKGRGDYCLFCHGNVHQKQFHKKFYGQPCTECHTTQAFEKRKSFDHNTTAFEIKGKHKQVKCVECHKKTKLVLTKDPLRYGGRYMYPNLEEKNCNTCHRDPHNGSYGSKCTDCHTEKSWKASYNFHENFELSEIHYTLACQECHNGEKILAGLSEDCVVCHSKDDIHRSSLPNCHECHRQSFWEVTKFKHSESTFPIRGAHRALNCNECHYNGVYQGLGGDCVLCHANDATQVTDPDHNQAAFKQNCDTCHHEFSFSGATKEN